MDRMQTSLICQVGLLLICLYHALASDAELDPIEKSSPANTAGSDKGPAPPTAIQTYRRSRMYRRGYHEGGGDSGYQDDQEQDEDYDQRDMKAMTQAKTDYWGGYYDFLINEGSYKFWAVFQLATAALLIYSGFAALYYAKVNPPTTDDEFDDIFRRRRRRRRSFPILARDRPFSGLDSATFQRIIDAIAREVH